MDNFLKAKFAQNISNIHLPRYNELPNMGLYLEQVTKYINTCIIPIGCTELTISMVGNYVKKGVIPSPVKKLYYAEQIAYLIFVSIAKNVLSFEKIIELVNLQKLEYDTKTAYDYLCSELENMLLFIAGTKKSVDNVGITNTEVKTIFRSIIISVSHMMFVNNCLETLSEIKHKE